MTDVLKRRDTETGKQKEKTKTEIRVMYLINFLANTGSYEARKDYPI